MEIFTVKEWQDNWDELIERVENGEHIGIVNEESGEACVMMSVEDPLYTMYKDHDEGC